MPRILRLLERAELRPAPLTAVPPLTDHVERLDATIVVADYGTRTRAEVVHQPADHALSGSSK